MLLMAVKISIAVIVISFSAWLSGEKTELAGYIMALPLVSILALVFYYVEHKDAEASIIFSKSILVGVPVSWLFWYPL